MPKDIELFKDIYLNTYNNILKYIICRCSNLDDVNDILQETYTEFYSILCRKKSIKTKNIENFLIGIAKNKIKKYYKSKTIKFEEFQDTFFDNSEIDSCEELIFTKDEIENIWEFLKKDTIKAKIFYLYYYCDMTFKEISKELQLKESTIKSIFYRTLDKIKKKFERRISDDR